MKAKTINSSSLNDENIAVLNDSVLILAAQDKRQDIYRELHLRLASGDRKKQKQAKQLYEYLLDNIEYSNEINGQLLSSENIRQTNPNVDAQKATNSFVLKSICSALLNKKGSCLQMSYTYTYLLSGLKIKGRTVLIEYQTDGDTYYHAVNAIKVSNHDYGFIDIANAQNAKKDYIKKDFKPARINKIINFLFLMPENRLEELCPNFIINGYQTIEEPNANEILIDSKYSKAFVNSQNHNNAEIMERD